MAFHSMRRMMVIGLVGLWAACGGRSTEGGTVDGGPDPEPGLCSSDGLFPSTSRDDECKGNTGCTKRPLTECGCHCVLCSDERCLSAICDDSCMPLCPSAKPVEGTGCGSGPPPIPSSCSYPIQSCPCGPSDLAWHCSCTAGLWRCSRDYDCYPCGIDAGVFPG